MTFNRTIVELKFGRELIKSAGNRTFNRTIVELKFHIGKNSRKMGNLLIVLS